MTARLADLAGLRHVAADVIYPHVFEHADREVGGVLVGHVPPTGGPPELTGAIPALPTEQDATLTFTQDAWDHVHRALDAHYPPQAQIVGWYRSRPGGGVVLSEDDLTIHHSFFGGLSQVALVVDPLGCGEGVFAWRAGEIALLFERSTPDGWQAVASPSPSPSPDPVPAPGAVPPPRRPQPAGPVPVLALVLAAVLGLGAGFAVERVLVGGTDDGVRTVTSPASAQFTAPASTAPRTERSTP